MTIIFNKPHYLAPRKKHNALKVVFLSFSLLCGQSLSAQYIDFTLPWFSFDHDLFPSKELHDNEIRAIDCIGINYLLQVGGAVDTLLIYHAKCDSLFRIIEEEALAQDYHINNQYHYVGNECFGHFITKRIFPGDDLDNKVMIEKWTHDKDGKKITEKTLRYDILKDGYPFVVVDTFFYNDSPYPTHSLQDWIDTKDSTKRCTLRIDYKYDAYGMVSEFKRMPMDDPHILLPLTLGCVNNLYEHMVVATNQCDPEDGIVKEGDSFHKTYRYRYTSSSMDMTRAVVNSNEEIRVFEYIKDTQLPFDIKIVGFSDVTKYQILYHSDKKNESHHIIRG